MTEPAGREPSNAARAGRAIHADAVVIGETGLLIRGASGAGKSRLALTLTLLAESMGFFARLVGDDRILVAPFGGRVVASGHPAIRGAIECRGSGILETRFLESVVLGLVVDLVPTTDALLPRCPEPGERDVELVGVTLPVMRLPCDLAPSDQATYVLQHFRLRPIAEFVGAIDGTEFPT